MVNSEDFIKRLEYLLEYHTLSASSFADKIGVQRSSISHLLSGRNKPSLDFIMKIMEEFPTVDLYWLLEGKGNFLKINNTASINQEIPEENRSLLATTEKKLSPLHPDDFLEQNNDIYKIVIFYKDGTFRDFETKK